ncbi:MAG: hypothetical protein ACLUTO_07615 [Anaerostipes sp.]
MDNSISTEFVSANPLYVPVAVFGFACSSFLDAVVTSSVESFVASVAVDTGFSSSAVVSAVLSSVVVSSVAASSVVVSLLASGLLGLFFPHAANVNALSTSIVDINKNLFSCSIYSFLRYFQYILFKH